MPHDVGTADCRATISRNGDRHQLLRFHMSSNHESGRRVRPDGMTLFFIVLAAISAMGVWLQDGAPEMLAALRGAGMLLLGIMPVIVAAMFIGGYVQVLLPRDFVARRLGDNSGAFGYLIAMVAGAITPAGPFGAFPIVLALRRAGAPFDLCVVYLSAWAMLGINRIVIWELPFLGHDFVALRVLSSLPLPIVAGLMARALPFERT